MQLHKVSLLLLASLILSADTAVAAAGGSASSGGGSGHEPAGVAGGGRHGLGPMTAAPLAAGVSNAVSGLNRSKDTPFRRVLGAILAQEIPKFEDIQALERVPTAGRRKHMRTELEAFAGGGVVESSKLRMVPGNGTLGGQLEADGVGEETAKLLARLRLPAYTHAFPDNMYQSLTAALSIMGTPDFVEPKYVMATLHQLAASMEDADAYFRAHPNVTLVLMAPDGNTLTLGQANIPASLKKLSIVGDHVTTIGYGFLRGCTGLTILDLSSLSNVTTIENSFLVRCSGLTNLDLSPLSKVITIGHDFLNGCTRLTTIDLSPLSKVTTIGHYFLAHIGLTPEALAHVEVFKAAVRARGGAVGGIDPPMASSSPSLPQVWLIA